MGNECMFSMRIKGVKANILELYKIINMSHPKKLGLFKTFDIEPSKGHQITDSEDVIVELSGVCINSVYSCMMDGSSTYYNSYIREGNFTDDFKGTNLLIESKRLNLEIEIYSVEYGDNFEEHYYIKNGNILMKRVENFELYYDDNDVEHGGRTMKLIRHF